MTTKTPYSLELEKRHLEYVAKLKKRHGDRIICIDRYRGSKTDIKHFCNDCKREWYAKPNNLVRKRASGCRLCAEDKTRRNKRTPEQYEQELFNIHNGNVIALEPYVSRKKELLHGCTICNHTWYVIPHNILNNHSGCPACARKIQNAVLNQNREHRKYTRETYLEKLQNIHFDTIQLIGEFVHTYVPTKHQCTDCNHIWKPLPTKLLEGRGCPKCKLSKGEKYIGNLLQSMNIEYEIEKTFDDLLYKNPLRFDFYIPSQNLLIEYDGEHHFLPINHFDGKRGHELTKKRDKIKDEYAKKHNIRLLRIPYTLTREEIRTILEEYIVQRKLQQ